MPLAPVWTPRKQNGPTLLRGRHSWGDLIKRNHSFGFWVGGVGNYVFIERLHQLITQMLPSLQSWRNSPAIESVSVGRNQRGFGATVVFLAAELIGETRKALTRETTG